MCRNLIKVLSSHNLHSAIFSNPKHPYLFKVSNSKFSTDEENSVFRATRLLKNDIKYALSPGKAPTVLPNHCDILVIGGGVIGCSIAYWLKRRALEGLSVVVVEKDPSVIMSDNVVDKVQYHQSTSMLSVGGLRQQFSLKENIELSLASAEFLRNIKFHLSLEGQDPPDIQFHPSGYLFLATEKSAELLTENYNTQKELGAKVELLTPDKLKERFPFMNTDGLALGCHGLENEGWFDPYSLLYALKRKAQDLGADYVNGEVIEFKFIKNPTVINKNYADTTEVNDVVVRLTDNTEHKIHFSILIVAAGGLSGNISSLLAGGAGSNFPTLPVEPRKRYVFCFHCPDGPGLQTPFIVDPSGAYVRREGLSGHYLCGISPPDEEEPPCNDLEVDYSYFDQKIWPILANRVPAFETAKMKNAWAGFYDFNKFDENAFIGPHPAFMNVFLANGFSGHGLQQAPAVGRAIMELIVDGTYQTIDLQRFHFNRYLEKKPLYESNIV